MIPPSFEDEITIYKLHIDQVCSRSLASDSSGELHVLGHDGHSLGVDGAKVGVLEQAGKVSLGGFLEGEYGGRLESEVVLELRCDLTDESLEGQLSNEKLGALLELSDFSECDGAGSESVCSLDSASGGNSLLGLLGSNVLSGCLATCVLSCGLLGACHFDIFI